LFDIKQEEIEEQDKIMKENNKLEGNKNINSINIKNPFTK
jgi:hypothetical protein